MTRLILILATLLISDLHGLKHKSKNKHKLGLKNKTEN